MKRQTILTLALVALLASSASALTVIDPGSLADSDPVDCGAHKGTVSVRTGVHFRDGEFERRGGVSIEFAATQGNAVDCCWVQFVRAQAVASTTTASYQLRFPIRTSGGEVVLSTDAAPSWHVDSAGKGPLACYESAGASYQDPDGTKIFDAPDNTATALAEALGRVTKVEVVLHFVAYLVCGRRVCATAVWTLRQTWTAPPGGMGPGAETSTFDPKPTVTPGGTIDPKQVAAANAEHAGQTVLPP